MYILVRIRPYPSMVRSKAKQSRMECHRAHSVLEGFFGCDSERQAAPVQFDFRVKPDPGAVITTMFDPLCKE